MADKAAERIKYETELLRLVFVLVIAGGGGSLSLLLGSPTPLRLILAGAAVTGAEIIAACLGVTLFIGVVVFAWKITSH